MNNQTTPQWLCHFGLRWNLEMVVLGGRGGRGITEYPKETEKLSHNGAKTGTNQKRIPYMAPPPEFDRAVLAGVECSIDTFDSTSANFSFLK